MCLRKLTAAAERLPTSQAPQSNASGTCQCGRSNVDPGGKYNAYCPPSGPSQNRSSPPNTFMCGWRPPDSIADRPIHPNPGASRLPTVLVITRPWYSGATTTWGPGALPSRTRCVCCSRNARSDAKLAFVCRMPVPIIAAAAITVRMALMILLSILPPEGGSHELLEPGGSHELLEPGGSHELLEPGGSHELLEPGGSHELLEPGGSHELLEPGGSHELLEPGGSHELLGAGRKSRAAWSRGRSRATWSRAEATSCLEPAEVTSYLEPGGSASTRRCARQSTRYVTDPIRGPSSGDEWSPMTMSPAL